MLVLENDWRREDLKERLGFGILYQRLRELP